MARTPSAQPEPDAPPAPSLSHSDLVGIVITCDHVYLPLDPDGNGRAEWQNVAVTTKVEKRARLKVPAALAEFLSDRDQAEIV